jgi:hypothetical protein
MRVLQELVAIINKNKVRQIEVIGNQDNKDTKVNQLYEGIVSAQFTSDRDAAAHFFNQDEKSSAYRNLKNTLKKRLINTVFFIDLKQPYYNDQQKAYYYCWKEWAAVKVLTGKSAKVSANELCKNILSPAVKYEFTDLLVEIFRLLRSNAATIERDEKNFEYYNEQFQYYTKVWLAVGKSEELYCRLISLYHRANISKQEIHEKAKVYYEELKPIMDEFDTYKIHLCGRLIHMAIHMSINDYVNTVKACDEAIDFFEGKSYVSALALQTFLNQKLICYTQLKKYEAGRDAAIRSNSIIQEGKFNWFKNLEIFFILCLHTQKYQEAYEVFDQVINHKLLKFQPKGIVEIWKINEAYVHYLVILGKVKPRRDDDRFNKFKLGRFLNEVPSFSKEKRRRNIPILIVQILFLILQKRYNDAIDRIETVDKYCYRYLRKDDSFRSNCFIKLLLLIPSCSFHKAAVTRKSKKYTKQLNEVPLEVANQPHEVEIIPYEILWEMALNSLENKFYKETKTGRQR